MNTRKLRDIEKKMIILILALMLMSLAMAGCG